MEDEPKLTPLSRLSSPPPFHPNCQPLPNHITSSQYQVRVFTYCSNRTTSLPAHLFVGGCGDTCQRPALLRFELEHAAISAAPGTGFRVQAVRAGFMAQISASRKSGFRVQDTRVRAWLPLSTTMHSILLQPDEQNLDSKARNQHRKIAGLLCQHMYCHVLTCTTMYPHVFQIAALGLVDALVQVGQEV